jgi:hypothetical protein
VRHIIIHYHIFKNAGTSIDRSLADSFGEEWRRFDHPIGWRNITTADLLAFLRARPPLKAFSSHHLRWPQPSTADIRPYPLVFVRHPIDRIASMYYYFRGIQHEQVDGRTFPEYVDWLLSPAGSWVARSFQTIFLSDGHINEDDSPEPPVVASPTRLAQAKQRLEHLPEFGVVERFDESIERLSAWLRPTFPQLVFGKHRLNASQDPSPATERRRSEVADALGHARYRQLLDANEADMELYDHAMRVFASRQASRLKRAAKIAGMGVRALRRRP